MDNISLSVAAELLDWIGLTRERASGGLESCDSSSIGCSGLDGQSVLQIKQRSPGSPDHAFSQVSELPWTSDWTMRLGSALSRVMRNKIWAVTCVTGLKTSSGSLGQYMA